MSLGLKIMHGPSPSTPHRPTTTSPILITDTSTRISPSPVTPSPKTLGHDWMLNRDQVLSTQDSESSLTYKNPNNSLDLWGPIGKAPQTTPKKTAKSEQPRVRTTPKKGKTLTAQFVIRKEYTGTGDRLAVYAKERKQLKFDDVERELQSMRKSLGEKETFIEELQSVVRELEDRLRLERAHSATLQRENDRLTSELRSLDKELQVKFSAEIARLSNMLSENAKKLNQKLLKPSVPTHRPSGFTPHKSADKTDSSEFAMFLLAENKRIADEMSEAKVKLQQSHTVLLTSLTAELASVRHDMSQLKTLLSCIRAGELVQLDVLWSQKPTSEERKSVNLTAECLKEIAVIRDCTAEMRKIASSFYAEQCGQSCGAQ